MEKRGCLSLVIEDGEYLTLLYWELSTLLREKSTKRIEGDSSYGDYKRRELNEL